MSKKLQRVLLVCAAANVAVIVWDLAAGGIYITAFGLVFSSWEIEKPLRYAAVSAAVAIWLHDRGAAVTSWDVLPRVSARAARALAFASIVAAGLLGIRAAGGADAFGYISQAQLWADGRVIAADPLAPIARDLGQAAAPLGYISTQGGDALVPTYPAGLPLMMAAALRLGGREAVYAVVPLLGGLTIWMTYLVGLRAADERTGLVAALLVAFSPLFVFHTFEPMSDVPATAWWTAAWAMALAPGAASASGAGVAAAAAILTRPNLAPLALVLLAVVAGWPPRWTRALLFASAAGAGCAIVAALNAAWYGSPFLSGYGPPADLFARDHLWPNLTRYTRWMFDLHTPVLLLALAAPLARRRAALWWMAMFCGAVGLSYLFYLVWDNWPFARFLLPSLPLVFVLVSVTLLRAIAGMPSAWRGAALLTICAIVAAWYVTVANRLHIFEIQRAEQRYATVGRSLGGALPPRAVVLSMIHSGSVRWHGGRLTLRWDQLAPDRLDAAVALLRAGGYQPYILLEDWEEPLFRRQFANASALGRIDWPPAMEYQGAARVRLYCVADRARHESGESIVTRPIAP